MHLYLRASTFIINLTSETNPSNPLNYLVYAQCLNENYSVILANNLISIVPRELTITINNQRFNYGDEIVLNQLDYTITSGSFAFNDQNSVRLTTSATRNSTVNEYDIDLTFNNMNKYDLTIVSGKAIISQKVIEISTQQSKIYGTENNLDNSNYTIISGNVVDGTDLQLNFTTTATKTSPVGDYEITAYTITL